MQVLSALGVCVKYICQVFVWSVSTHVLGYFLVHASKSNQYSEMDSRYNLGTSEFDFIKSCCTVITISILAAHLESERESMSLPCSVSTLN